MTRVHVSVWLTFIAHFDQYLVCSSRWRCTGVILSCITRKLTRFSTAWSDLLQRKHLRYVSLAICESNQPVTIPFPTQGNNNVDNIVCVLQAVLYFGWFNPLRATFVIRNIKMYLQFISYLHNEMAQLVEVLSHIRQELTHST